MKGNIKLAPLCSDFTINSVPRRFIVRRTRRCGRVAGRRLFTYPRRCVLGYLVKCAIGMVGLRSLKPFTETNPATSTYPVSRRTVAGESQARRFTQRKFPRTTERCAVHAHKIAPMPNALVKIVGGGREMLVIVAGWLGVNVVFAGICLWAATRRRAHSPNIWPS